MRLAFLCAHLVIAETSGERFTRMAEAVSWVWSSRVGKAVWGMPVVLVLGTTRKWKVPIGMRIWRKGGPSKVALAIGLLRQARRHGRQPADVLWESGSAAAELLNLLAGWGWHSVRRLKWTRKFGEASLRTTWPHRYGHAQGALRGVVHPVFVVQDGRRYGGTNDRTRTVHEVKPQYSPRQQSGETFRLLKQEFSWGNCSCQKHHAQWAHLLGLYALVLTQQTAFTQGQTIYAFRQSLLLPSLP